MPKVTSRNFVKRGYSSFHIKSRTANERAQMLRRKGYSVRVVKLSNGFALKVNFPK